MFRLGALGFRSKSTIWIVAILFFLRLPALALGVIAAALMGAGVYLQVLDNEREAAFARALVEGPPAVVDIAQFDADSQTNAAKEAHVQAQLSVDHIYDLWLEKDYGGSEYIVMVPLVDAEARTAQTVLGVALFEVDGLDQEFVTPAVEKTWYVEDGALGPIWNLNGRIARMGDWQSLIEDSFYDEGLTMPENPVVIWGYGDGREVALAPREAGAWTIFGVVSKVAGAIGLLALFKVAVRSRPEETPLDEGSAPAPSVATERTATPVAAQRSGVPLWKQRAGVAGASDDFAEPVFEDPQFDADPALRFDTPTMENDPIVKPRRAFGLRKILIGIVGMAFVVLLGSVLWGLISDSRANDRIAAIPTAEERLADVLVDQFVPEADPNRHWTDIDVTPVIEWFVAKGLAALGGDTNAMISLGLVIGGVFMALFMLRWYFFVRVTRGMTRRNHNFDDLRTG